MPYTLWGMQDAAIARSSGREAHGFETVTHHERPRPHVGIAVLAAVVTFLVIGLPTDIVPNPLFGREVPVRQWEPWVVLAPSVLTGL